MNSDSDEEFFDGFAWPVPTAFSASLNQCRFERGDVFYDSPKGYEKWEEALKYVTFSLKVSYPPHSLGRIVKPQTITEVESVQPASKVAESQDVFTDNWKSKIVFTLHNHKTNESREIESTQGRLYTLLWRGDWKILEMVTEPEVPLTCLAASKRLEKPADEIKARSCARMAKPNVFVMAYDPTHPIASNKYEAVKRRLRQDFTVVEEMFKPYDVGLQDVLIVPTVKLVAFLIDLGASAKISDALKEVLYKPSPNRISDKDKFRVKTHGAWLPSHSQHFGDLATVSFRHGPIFYRYRFSQPRLSSMLPELRDFLLSVAVDCPNHYFQTPPSCSQLKLTYPIDLKRVREHKLIDFAGQSCDGTRYKSAHENVQMHFLENDNETIAVEVPVWAEWSELGDFSRHIEPEGTLTGHIDLLRYSSGNVEVWDYKPNAFEETCAAMQVFFYALLLSKRTAIPLTKIKCGYFDPSNAYLFDAHEAAGTISKMELQRFGL